MGTAHRVVACGSRAVGVLVWGLHHKFRYICSTERVYLHARQPTEYTALLGLLGAPLKYLTHTLKDTIFTQC